MRIDRIELYHVAMPLISPWRTAYGEDREVHSLLCRMESGSLDGWGESTPFAAPCYSPEWAGGALAVARHWLAPAIIHRSISSGEALQSALSIYKGNPFAKAALDTAWWSLHCKRENMPLSRALGATRNEAAVGADFGVMDAIEDLLSAIDAAVSEGFPRIKLKFRPGWDRDMLRAVRKHHPRHTLHIDCNGAYRLADSEMLRSLDAFDLAMIEQPLQHDDLHDHAQLQSMIATPICLDESITSPDKARQALELRSCRYVNIKPGRVGGLTPAVRIHELCRQQGIACWVGGMLESAVGASHCASLAMLDNFTYPADLFPSSRFYHEDLAYPPMTLHKDAHGVPSVSAPRTLAEPLYDRLRQWTVEMAVVS